MSDSFDYEKFKASAIEQLKSGANGPSRYITGDRQPNSSLFYSRIGLKYYIKY